MKFIETEDGRRRAPVTVADVEPGHVFTLDLDDMRTRHKMEEAGRFNHALTVSRPGEKFQKLAGDDGFVWQRTDELLVYENKGEGTQLKVAKVWEPVAMTLRRIK